MSRNKVGVFGCRHNTYDVLKAMGRAGYAVDQIVTVSPSDAGEKYHISGYYDLQGYADEQSIPLYHVEDYGLKNGDQDRKELVAMDLDLVICIGWQRIVPGWYLDSLSIGAIGMHGGPKPPPFGRGHSVMNWSLIEGRDAFYCYLFFYVERVDAGPIVGMQKFDITDYDDCETLHFKYQISMQRLLLDNLPQILSDDFEPTPQNSVGATYYPARKPDDGKLDWAAQVKDVHGLVRGVTRPYPGAFTTLDGERVNIWRGQPFDSQLTWNKAPGTILDVFYNGKFLVQCRDYAYFVQDSDGYTPTGDDIGKRFDRA